eukprot:TRINITY_DN40_c0_g1_i3.p1 TRINITY_DN40_c0_g1~~TRINITY_DN40_c0_g1_i3.p1  ORF type:complete len:481 (-),score=74.82 TRINITY_DN40_c0_g1_i3:1563-3005(-)
MNARLLISVLLAITTAAITTQAAFINQTWTITYKTVLPDGRKKLVPVVNNQYPGPALRGKVNDIVQITVINRLPTETTTIHWHGIKQTATPWSDGVPAISQCAIGPAETFVYRFKLDAPGTLWWHSHSGLQKSSLYGAIIIDGDQKVLGKHKDIVLLLNDWYHASGAEQVAGLVGVPFKWVGDAQSFLINGKGDFNCTDADIESEKCDPDTDEKGPLIIDVEPSTTYRLRIVGASSLAFINFNIDAHSLRMVEAETTLLKPFNTRFLDVGPGQSFSALLRTKSLSQLRKTRRNNGLFWMQTNIRHRSSGPRGLAILRYSTNSGAKEPLRRPPTPPEKDDITWSLMHARRFRSRTRTKLPAANRTFVFLGTQNQLPNERLVWALNNITYVDGPSPILHSVKLGVYRDTKTYVQQLQIPTPFDYTKSLSENGLPLAAKEGTQVVKVKKDEVIDWVFQNTVSLSGADEIHPWYVTTEAQNTRM